MKSLCRIVSLLAAAVILALQPGAALASLTVTTSQRLATRTGPGTKYDIVGKVKDNSYILYSGEYGDKWYKVYTQAGTLRGYISANKLEPLESPAF